MCFLYFTLLLCTNAIVKADEIKNEPYEALNSVYNISDKLVLLLNKNEEEERIKELKEKLDRINHYVVDNNLVANILTNVTNETRLNATNFYEALKENDHFRFLSSSNTKNLYLKLKEKMTRDDVMQIVAEKGENSKLVKSARRMMENNLPKKDEEEVMNDVVDKLLGESPNDQHKIKQNESAFWDPQGELEDKKAYHESKRSGRRLFRGERTTIRSYPFMASVHLMGKFWCGAVLYGSDMCITSASCLQLMHNNRFFRENPKILQVRVGSNHSRIGGEKIDVMEVYFHPGYNPRTLKCNLAIVRLRRHLFYSNKAVPKYIDIDRSRGKPPATSEVLLLGWGVTKVSQKLAYEPIYLQKKILPVYPNAFCKEIYGEKFISETMFCAGTLTTGEGACDHDAGGPAILAGRLIGIISFGPSICGFADAPTVFTLVGAYTDWIESVNESMPSYYRGYARTTTTTISPLNDYLATYVVGGDRSTTLLDPAGLGEEAMAPGGIETTTGTATEGTTTATSPITPTSPSIGLRELLEENETDGGWSIE